VWTVLEHALVQILELVAKTRMKDSWPEARSRVPEKLYWARGESTLSGLRELYKKLVCNKTRFRESRLGLDSEMARGGGCGGRKKSTSLDTWQHNFAEKATTLASALAGVLFSR